MAESSTSSAEPVEVEDTSLEFALISAIACVGLLIICGCFIFSCKKVIRYTSKEERTKRLALNEKETTEEKLLALLQPSSLSPPGLFAEEDHDDDVDPNEKQMGRGGGYENNLESKPAILERTPEEVAEQAIQNYHARINAVKRMERKLAKARRKRGQKGEMEVLAGITRSEDDSSSEESSDLSTSSDEEGNAKPTTIRKRARKDFEVHMIREEARAQYAAAAKKYGLNNNDGEDSDEEVPLEIAMVRTREHPENFLHPLPTENSRGAGDEAPKNYAAMIVKGAPEKAETEKYKTGNFTSKNFYLQPDIMKGQPGRAPPPDPKNPMTKPPRRSLVKEQTPWSFEATSLMQSRLNALKKERRRKPKARVHIEDATFLDSDDDDDDRSSRGGAHSEAHQTDDDDDDSTIAGGNAAELLRATSAYRGARGESRATSRNHHHHHGTNSSTSGSFMTGSASFISSGSAFGFGGGGGNAAPPPSANSWEPVVTPTQRLAAARLRTLGQEEDAKPIVVNSQQTRFPREDTHVIDFKGPVRFDAL